MKVVILAGGFGTRISEESVVKPKPMVEIGEQPILWHIMKEYFHYGFDEFIICAGYKQHIIKEYFHNYALYRSDITFDFSNDFSKEHSRTIHNNFAESWKVTVVDTGRRTMTGGRIKRIKEYLDNEPFMLTYGDGVADLNIRELAAYHKSHGKMVTMSTYNSGQRFGVLDVDKDGTILEFREKTVGDSNIINIGYMVCNPQFLDYIGGDDTVLEKGPLEAVARAGQLMAYKHTGFWQCMDTLREKTQLEELWASGKAPWKVWE